MPRVLLTGFCAAPGPRRVGVQLRHVIRALTSLHSVDVLVVREGEQAYVERQGSVRVLRVPTPEGELSAHIQSFQRALKRQLEGADYDVVHCRDAWSAITVLEARERLGYAVVYDLSRSPLGDSGLPVDLEAAYERDEATCLDRADLILAPTPAAVKALAARVKPEKVRLSPPGVDVDRFDWEDPPVGGGVPKILYAGAVDPGRGVRVLIRAMAAIVAERDARLVLAGPIVPAFEPSLREALRELKLVDKVEVLGAVDHDQLPMLIAGAWVCVAPAAADLSPNPSALYPTKLLEYMACKRAIVAPRRETVSMVVENGREALLFEPGDPADLARKILRLLAEPLLRQRIASAGYERVRRDFTASAARRALRHAYAELGARFADQLSPVAQADEPARVDLLADDDFEATMFEELPGSPAVTVDTAVHALAASPDPHSDSAIDVGPVDVGSVDDSGAVEVGAVEVESGAVESVEAIVELAPSRPLDSGAWMRMAPASAPSAPDEWVVTNPGRAKAAQRSLFDDSGEISPDDGTPSEGLAVSLSAPVETAFVAGEIDVPTSPPGIAPSNEDFTAAGGLLGTTSEPPDPDTGTGTRTQTPTLERR